MEEFTNLTSLYKHLENNADNYKYPHQIGNLFQKIRDIEHKSNHREDSEKAQFEVDFFNFTIKKGKLSSSYAWPNAEGKMIEYPVLEDKMYSYLIKRFNNTSNPLLKARYSTILWCSPKKLYYSPKTGQRDKVDVSLSEKKGGTAGWGKEGDMVQHSRQR